MLTDLSRAAAARTSCSRNSGRSRARRNERRQGKRERVERSLFCVRRASRCIGSVVVLLPEMRDEILPLDVPQRVLELHELDEEIVLGVEPRRVHRALEVEREPFLDAAHADPLRHVHEEREVEDDRRGEDASRGRGS